MFPRTIRTRFIRTIERNRALGVIGLAGGLTLGLSLLTLGCPSEIADGVLREFRADLQPINEQVTGMATTGTVVLKVGRDSIYIEVEAENAPPAMMHLMHYHGFPEVRGSICASMDQDLNGDGIVDLIETQPVSGQTLVPFHADPASLDIQVHSYPVADSTGTLSYRQTIARDALAEALRKEMNIESPEFGQRTVYLHGVDADLPLPETVQSLPGVDPHITLPIACGKLILVGP